MSTRRVRLTAPDRLADDLLRAVPEVSAIARHGDELIVTGSGDLLSAVVVALHHAGLRAEDIRPESANLEDAFLELTGRHDARKAEQE